LTEHLVWLGQGGLAAAVKSAAMRLPLPQTPISPDDLPSLEELWHWSGRLTHAALAIAVATNSVNSASRSST